MAKGFRHIPSRVAVIAIIGSFFLFNGFNSVPVYAASDISVSNSGKVSFGKVSASSTGTLATGQDTLNITTDCEAGANVYATSVNGSSTGTSLINLAAKEQDPSGTSSASYTINTSSATIGSASALANNTWGLNTNVMEAGNGSFYGLPEYSASGLPTVIYSGTNTELPIYYGAKVTNSLAPGTYTGEVLYTVTVNNSCLDYTVKFNKNANDATGEMSDQSILPTGGTLSENSFTYSGYAFLGWSLDPAGKTGTATNGIGTAEDVDFEDKASFPGSNEGILPGSETTLYAIWEKQTIYMQNWIGCAKMRQNEVVTLIDSRDNHEYKVKKLPDGNCWMIQNLTLSADDIITEGKALTSADTNIDNNTTYYLPKAGYQGSITNPSTPTSTSSTVNFSTSGDSQGRIAFRATTPNDSNPAIAAIEDTSYYNFYTATLGYAYDGTGSYGSSTRDICPKGWRLPWTSDNGTVRTLIADFYTLATAYNSNATWTNPLSASLTKNPYTADTYIRQNMVKGDTLSLNPELATNGAIGFTYTGYYNGTTLSELGGLGNYWASSIYANRESYHMQVNDIVVAPQTNSVKSFGFAVRCIDQYSDITGYMQDFDTNDLAPGESTTLLDKRDGSSYTVKKFGSGNDTEVWMTSNLTLGHDKGYTLTSADTNIPDSTTYYLPPAGKRGSVTSSSTVTATNTATFDTSNVSEAHVQYRAAGQAGDQSSTGTLFQNTGYYNYPAATLGYSYYNDGLSSGNSPRDICPAGWQLPRGSSTSTYSFYWLDRALGGTGSNRTDTTTRDKFLNDASFGYSGYYGSSQLYYVGSYGYWWSSTLSSSAHAYLMRLGSDGGVYPQSSGNKYYGFSIRCIAKESYTINYNANGGTGEMTPSKGYIGGGTVLSRNTFTKDGYYFIGWSTNPSATTATYADGATISTNLTSAGDSVTLYAIWDTTLWCSNTTHPGVGSANACKMRNDGREWFYGNGGSGTSWANLTSSMCSGGTIPTRSDYETLISREGSGSQLYNTIGKSTYFWSSSTSSGYGVYMHVTDSAALIGVTNSNSNGASVLCYK